MRGLRGSRGVQRDEHIDAAAVVAQALNRLPPEPGAPATSIPDPQPMPAPARMPEPVPVLTSGPDPIPAPDPAPEPPAEAGAIIRVPLSTEPGTDPLADDLIAFGMSLSYDVTSSYGAALWREIVVELPPTDPPEFAADIGESWLDFHPSMHSRGCLDVLSAQLQELDPGVGFDIVLRPREMIVCRWPSRAWDVRDAEPVPEPTIVPEAPAPEPGRRR